MRLRPNASVATLFLLPLALSFSFQTPARAADAQADEYDETARVARVSLVRGEVTLRRAGSDEWERVRPNLPLVEGDTLATGHDSRAEIQLDARNFVRLGPDTVLRLTTLREEGVAFSLSEGAATFRLARFDRGREYFEVDAPKTTVAAERQGLYRLDVGGDGRVRVTVRDEGRARVYSETSGFVVRAGRTAYLTYDGYGEGDWELSAAPSDDWWDQWVDERERHLAARLRFDGRERYYDPEVWGAEELDLYGDWSHTREYGYVWRPHVTVVNNYYNWAPYRHGRWSWFEPYGWTWVPDEEWGWAPYHYGRWVYLNNGWCWAPRGYGYHYRRARWRPALVAFVQINVSRGEHIAWYPLTYGQRDPRGRLWRRGYDRLTPLRAGEAAGLTRANPALLRAVTTQPAREFGVAGVRARPALGEVARQALTAEPLTGSLPVVPARGAGGRIEARAPRAGVTRGRAETGDGRGGLVIVRPETVQPPRAVPARPTGAAERAAGVALDERLRRTRVFNNREPRVFTSTPEAGTAPSTDAGMGAVTRPAPTPRRLPTDSSAGPETDGGRPGARVRRQRPHADADAGREAGVGSTGDVGGEATGPRPAPRTRRPERISPDDEPTPPRVRRSRPEGERPNTESPEPSGPRVSPPSESVERPQPPARRTEPRPPRVERPEADSPRPRSRSDETPREEAAPRRESPRESPRRVEPAEQPTPRVHAPQQPKQERAAPSSRPGDSPRTAPRVRPAERPQPEQLEKED
jgi:hypothetical protein